MDIKSGKFKKYENKRKKRSRGAANNDRWLVSYADFITLMFAFFVVMYALSSINQSKYKLFSKSLDGAFSGKEKRLEPISVGEIALRDTLPSGVIAGFPGGNENLDGRLALESINQDIQNSLSYLINDGLLSVRRDDNWIQLELKSSLMFSAGSALLKDEAIPILAKISGLVSKSDNLMRMEGFTDNQPIQNVQYPSNWELSSARACSIVREFIKNGIDPSRMSAVGFADLYPVDLNTTEEGRVRNRRVIIFISSVSNKKVSDALKNKDSSSSKKKEFIESRAKAISNAVNAGSPK